CRRPSRKPCVAANPASTTRHRNRPPSSRGADPDMIPEIGQYAMILALLLAAAQTFFGLAGSWRGQQRWMQAVYPAVAGQFVLLALAFGCLVWAFVHNDFSVRLVAANSNSALPVYFRIAATWGNHEGSMLFWVFVLSIWTLAVAACSSSLPRSFVARVLGVLGILSARWEEH